MRRLGAFSGPVVGQSEVGHDAGEELVPLRDAFAVLFFVLVGMLIDPASLLDAPGRILAIVAVIVVGKTAAAFLNVLALRGGLHKVLVVAAALGQIGESSFILAGVGRALDLLPAADYNLILAGALVSIVLNPLLFRAASLLAARPAAPRPTTAATRHPRSSA